MFNKFCGDRRSKMKKLILGIVLTAMLLVLPAFTAKAEVIESGVCGEHVTWTIDSEGTMMVYGEGKMYDGFVWYESFDEWYDLRGTVKALIVEEGVTSIGIRAFAGCGSLETVILPDSLVQIGEYGFESCVRLTSLMIPPHVTSIDERAFSGCTGLSVLIIPDSVTSIGERAFFRCTSISELTIPSSVENMGSWAFSRCEGLNNLTVQDGIDGLGNWTFANCDNLTTITIPESLRSLNNGVFDDCMKVKDLYYAGTAALWETMVRNCDGGSYFPEAVIHCSDSDIKMVNPHGTCGKNTADYYDKCFWTLDANGLMPISGQGEIGTRAYGREGDDGYGPDGWLYYDVHTRKIQIEEGISAIGSYMFERFENVVSIGIPVSVTSIEKGAFWGFSSLSDIYYAGTSAQWDKVQIDGSSNDEFMNAAVHFASTEKETQTINAKAKASSVAVGKTTTITTTGAKGSLTYKSSDTAIATVGSTGKVTAKKVGTVKITVTAAETDEYKKATKTVTIKVVPAATSSLTTENLSDGIKLTWKKVTDATGYYIYRNGKQIKKITSGSTLTYKDTGAKTNGTKYVYKVVAYAGTGTSTLSKEVTTYYTKRPVISSVKAGTKQFTVIWSKNSKASGYQVQYSTTSGFTKGNKTVTVTSASTVKKVVKSLTAGKTYYVRVRAYKTLSGTKIYSAWSAKKSVKVK